MDRLRVGVIGLEEVAQIIHLPILEVLSNRYEVTALCDVSPRLLSLIGDRYGVDRLYTDAIDLIEKETIDATLVLNSDEYHTDCVVAAAENRRHVFVEKPMCLTRADAEEIIRAKDKAGIKDMVGYMRSEERRVGKECR